MEIEAQTLLLEDEKLGISNFAQQSSKRARFWSWAVPATTHSVVALLVLLAVTFTPMAGFLSNREQHIAETRPTLYCKFKYWPLNVNVG